MPKATIFDNCSNCLYFPCQLPSDPTCILKSYYNDIDDVVSFELKFTPIDNKIWFGIVFNSAENPGMVFIN